ncbi:MAG TPA: alkaline phosphatase [Longimicrobiales bacterium]
MRHRATARIGSFAVAASVAVAGSGLATHAAGQEARPTSVILLVADGAGVAHWTLARFASDDLAVDRMPVAGLVNTRGWDHEITGSAAGATALATGVRTFIGAIGVGPDSLPRESALELASGRGWATGLITTTSVADATPAAFAAHVASRDEMVEIFRQMTAAPVDVILGGGRNLLARALERDSLDLRSELEERYAYVETAAALEDAVAGGSGRVLGLFAPGSMARAGERTPSLVEMTRAALAILEKDEDGFFLMVENEGSDTEAHANAERDVLTAEMLDFDAAVGVALDHRERNPGTLVVVVADHETGGIHLTHDANRDIVMGYATTYHTAALVPLFAAGPGAERFSGMRDNDEVGRALMELMGR